MSDLGFSGVANVLPLEYPLSVRDTSYINGLGSVGGGGVSTIDPSLQLNFLNAAIDNRITFTRASLGTRFNLSGLLETIGYNQILQSVLPSGISGTVGSTAVAPTDWIFINTGGTVNFSPYGNGENQVRFVVSDGVSRPALGQAVSAAIGENIALSATVTSVTGAAQVQNIVSFGGVTGSNVYFINGASVAGATNVSNGDRVAIVVNVASVTATQARFGVGSNGAANGDVTMAYPMFTKEATSTTAPATYSPTTTAANSGPRFDYDPAVPAGVTGSELAPPLTTAGWAFNSEWAIVNNTFVLTGTGALSPLTISLPITTVGKTYQIRYTLVSVSGGGGILIQSGLGANVGTQKQIPGNYTEIGVADSPFGFGFKRQSGVVNAVISNVSIREVTFTPKGLLIEESRTNAAFSSGNFAGAFWDFIIGSTLGTSVNSPDNTLSGVFVREDTSTGGHLRGKGSLLLLTAETVTGSFFARAGGRTRVRVELAGSAGGGARASFELAGAGTLLGTVGTGATPAINISQTIAPVGGGWYRCTVSMTMGLAGSTSFSFINSLIDTGTNVSYTGDGVSGMYFWGLQLEAGAFPTSYIPTTTAAVTRATEAASMASSPWYNQPQGTFITESDIIALPPTSGTILNMNNGGFNERLQVRYGGGPSVGTILTVGGSVLASPASVTPNAVGLPTKVGHSYIAGGQSLVARGLTVQTAAAASVPTPTTLQLGNVLGVAGEPLNGHIRSIQYYRTRLPDAILQSLTV